MSAPSSQSTPPEGQRFSHVYANRRDPLGDSPRMRRRLASLIKSRDDFESDFSKIAEEELGIQSPWSSTKPWTYFIDAWSLQDVLDLVTIGYRHARRVTQTHQAYSNFDHAKWWVTGVRRIFAEENVHYTVDDKGGVHFKFDEELSRTMVSAISVLAAQEYENVRSLFEAALADLAKAPPQGREAIRGTFHAVEGLFRKMYPEVERLAAKATDRLRPRLTQVHGGDKPALEASEKMLLALRGWIDAAHEYRHEQGKPESAQPPLMVAVYLVSVGAAHLRWLAELDSTGHA